MTFTADQAQRSAGRRRVRDVKQAAARRMATMLRLYGRANMGGMDSKSLQIKMIVSDWSVDDFGNRCRTVRGE